VRIPDKLLGVFLSKLYGSRAPQSFLS